MAHNSEDEEARIDAAYTVRLQIVPSTDCIECDEDLVQNPKDEAAEVDGDYVGGGDLVDDRIDLLEVLQEYYTGLLSTRTSFKQSMNLRLDDCDADSLRNDGAREDNLIACLREIHGFVT